MRKYGVTNVNDHFLSFNTICDATQVNFLSLSLVHDQNLDAIFSYVLINHFAPSVSLSQVM